MPLQCASEEAELCCSAAAAKIGNSPMWAKAPLRHALCSVHTLNSAIPCPRLRCFNELRNRGSFKACGWGACLSLLLVLLFYSSTRRLMESPYRGHGLVSHLLGPPGFSICGDCHCFVRLPGCGNEFQSFRRCDRSSHH
jgi:hypothetical protein